MAGIGAIASLLGTVVSAAGTMAAAQQQKAAADWQALEYERQAKAERASAQADAMEQQRRKDLALARLRTVAAASGFSATDPTALDIGGDIQKYGTYRQQLVQFGGEDRAAGLKGQATATRLAGQAAATGARYRAIGTLIGGFSGLAKYGGGGTTSGGGGDPYFGFGVPYG